MMVSAFLLIVYTANILGSFSDPFEFEGDYGSKMNPIRQQIFERVVPREALTKHLTDSEIRQRMEKEDASTNEIEIYRGSLITQAIEEDRQHGPTLGELVSSELISDLKNQQQNLRSFSDSELQDILHFVEHYGDKQIFRFLHNTPYGFLSLDKALPDMAAQEGRDFSLPLLSSTEKLIDTDAGVLFTQESDDFTRQALVEDGLFLSVHGQKPKDGCFIFLRSNIWQPTYEIFSIDGYEDFHKGHVNLILATMYTGEQFLLASAHGNSTNAEDGRLQITLIMDAFHQLKQERGYDDLQLLIGMDANTKTESDVIALQKHLSNLGLVGTNVGPTTVKRRMVTVQHSKAGKFSIDKEDYLITLQRKYGGKYLLADPTVGLGQKSSDPTRVLPDVDNPSDHYPVGAALRAI